ncbi:MAG: CFI-box-CTERM domain-containing protein [Acidobacteriota bacterium]
MFLGATVSLFLKEEHLSASSAMLGGGFVGIIAGFLIAGILIGYVSSIEEQDRREKERAEKEARRTKRYAKKYDELIAAGMDAEEAEVKADLHAKSMDSACFIATAVYGSSAASEVILFRQWRDECLLSFPLGRVLVKTYYAASPHVAGAVERNLVARRMTRAVLRIVLKLLVSKQVLAAESKEGGCTKTQE